MAFIGTPGSADEIQEAVAFASFENMRKMETNSTFWLSGGRMRPRDRQNPQSFKTRRGKVGGYRDYFDDGEIAQIDRLVEEQLSPVFGYAGQPPRRRRRAPDLASRPHGFWYEPPSPAASTCPPQANG